jgi:hypothetical protein
MGVFSHPGWTKISRLKKYMCPLNIFALVTPYFGLLFRATFSEDLHEQAHISRMMCHTLYVNPDIFLPEIENFHTLSEFRLFQPGKCHMCNFTVRNSQADSTPRDIVITMAFSNLTNIVPFTRTLRTTGCHATFVLFVDPPAWQAIDRNLQHMLDSCGCTPRLPCLPHGDTPVVARFGILWEFLRDRQTIFDRVLIVDLYDVVFQGDPFQAGLERETVGVSEENIPCDRNQKYSAFLLISHRIVRRIWYNSKCKNGGLLIGGIMPIVRFLELFVAFISKIPHDRLVEAVMVDQVAINLMYGLGEFDRNGIAIRVWNEHDPYRVIWKLFDRANVSYLLGDYRLYLGEIYPLVIHMFDRSTGFRDSVVKACPPLFRTRDAYVRWSAAIVP